MEVILLERVNRLGAAGDLVKVKDGYGRNFLLPKKKALRATKQNKEFFEAQKAVIEADNKVRKSEAEKLATLLVDQTFAVSRQAGEDGRLFGSVSARDIANAINESKGLDLAYSNVVLNSAIKTIGTYEIQVSLHSDVAVNVSLQVTRE